MPNRETSFRIGCGRYLQKGGLLRSCGEEIARFGSAPLIVGGPTALSLTRDKIECSMEKQGLRYRICEYSGTCNEPQAESFARLAKNEGYDVIVGVGGGVIMDLAKLIAARAELPVVNVPTSTATCAAYTPLTIVYTPEGHTVGNVHHWREVDAVLVDSEIIVNQPKRLLLAGVFDALAKLIEIKHRYSGDGADCPLGLDWAYLLSEHSYKVLCERTEEYLSADELDPDGRLAEQVIFTLIAVTGVISGIARGLNQAALAHGFYYTARTLFHEETLGFLHGELVGVGLLLQNVFNGDGEERVILDMMKKHGMPRCFSDIGLTPTSDTVNAFYEGMKTSAAVLEGGAEAEVKLREALEYLRTLG